jgi:O-methyltransferase involved in polyketide biosynthesis
MQDQLINNVSYTALWIAAYRAQESERPDAVFKDPLARKLAGERGFKMVEATPIKEHMAFAMVARTTGIDRLINVAIERGIDTVINLGAGYIITLSHYLIITLSHYHILQHVYRQNLHAYCQNLHVYQK